MKVLATQLCLTLCDPVDCSLPGSSVQGILQARTDPGIEPGSPALWTDSYHLNHSSLNKI